VGFFLVV